MTTIVLPPKNQVEALLFASGRSMSVESLATLTGLSPDVARRACKTLAKELDDRESALMLYEVDGGWKMTAREAYTMLVKAIVADAELSRACMETLAVIAYKHPNAIQSEVIDTRGSGAYDHIAELERLGFVAKVPFSRSFKLKLTEKFFTYFDVKGGEAEMRKVFENIKLPDPTVQQTLGDLSVVAVDPVPERKDGLEVVGVPEGGTPMSTMGWIAMIVGVVVTLALGAGLMALINGGHRYTEKDDSAVTRHTYDKRTEDRG